MEPEKSSRWRKATRRRAGQGRQTEARVGGAEAASDSTRGASQVSRGAGAGGAKRACGAGRQGEWLFASRGPGVCGARSRAAAETGDRAWCSALRGRLAGRRVGVQAGECVSRAGWRDPPQTRASGTTRPSSLRERRAQQTECRGQRAARLQTTSSGLIRQGLGVRGTNKGRRPN